MIEKESGGSDDRKCIWRIRLSRMNLEEPMIENESGGFDDRDSEIESERCNDRDWIWRIQRNPAEWSLKNYIEERAVELNCHYFGPVYQSK